MADSDPALLTTAAAVIDAVGGSSAAARLTGARPQNASNWRSDGRLPPRTFLLFDDALADLGKAAPSQLWGIEPGRKAVAGRGV